MPQSLPRLILCTKDIMKITGKSKRTSERIMASLRKKYPQQTNCGITITLFANWSGIPEEKLIQYII